MFPTDITPCYSLQVRGVAIPSNRVNVSYGVRLCVVVETDVEISRNPLESGQCFLPRTGRQGYLFGLHPVAIPSNRVNVSYTL